MLVILLFIQLEKITARTETFKRKLSLQKWFYDNEVFLNEAFLYFYMSFNSNPDNSDLIPEDSTKITSAEEYVVLGVTIGNRLTFYNHLKSLCKKITIKLNALRIIVSCLYQIRLMYNSFFKRQLSYCPLI